MTQIARDIDRNDIMHLFNNLELILANYDKIISCDKYYNIQMPSCYIGGTIIGKYKMYLGDVLTIWQNTLWHTDTKYFLSISGSSLSGSNTARWYNTKANAIESGHYEDGLGALAKPAIDYIKTRPANKTPSELTLCDLIEQL